MTLPLLRPIRRHFPLARIHVLVPSTVRELLSDHPYIDRLWCFDAFWFYRAPLFRYLSFLRRLKRQRFDLVIEARGDIRDILLLVRPLRARYKVGYGVGGGAWMLTHVVPYLALKHKVEYHLDIVRYLGAETGRIRWGIGSKRGDRQAAADLLSISGVHGPFVCAHPGARLPLKRWPAHRCASLYDRMIEQFKRPLVLVGTADENGLIRRIVHRMRYSPAVLAGKLDLRMLTCVLESCDLFVCNDSGPMHIAAATGTPTVAVFGPSSSVETAPYGNHHRVVERDMPCRETCDEHRCLHHRHHACMADISAADVCRAVSDVLEGTEK
jgi:ADP-heptose:LPS heptosyltransferase